ncbi:MAG TPA: hypothetical protein VGN34_21385 [Ktedonobacteraceae bacterium]|jgi:hypothetical protein
MKLLTTAPASWEQELGVQNLSEEALALVAGTWSGDGGDNECEKEKKHRKREKKHHHKKHFFCKCWSDDNKDDSSDD